MNELTSIGLILLLALAQPAFRETADEDWLKKSDLAVAFLDRYGKVTPQLDAAIARLGTLPVDIDAVYSQAAELSAP